MKRIWIAVALVAICITFAITEFSLVNKKADTYIEYVDKSYDYFSDKEYSEAYKTLIDAQKSWNDSEKTLNVFLSHDKTDEIDNLLTELSEYAQKKNSLLFEATFEKTKRQLLRLKQSELPILENIM